MKLKTLTNLLKSGNMALGQKLSNLLTEDCVILEYTDDAVLFSKNNRLVLAKFKHNLTESKMTADDVLDNEVIYISGKDTQKTLKEAMESVVDNIADANYVAAEEALREFSETYNQYFVLKTRYPELFTENLVKKSPGYKYRRAAHQDVANFRSEVFSVVALKESATEDFANLSTVLESYGHVLLLGKAKVSEIIKDAVFGNKALAESVTEKLFEMAKELPDSNDILSKASDEGYDFDAGKLPNEQDEELASEDLDSTEDIETDFPVEDEGPIEFKEFDPSKLTDEDVKKLHAEVLKGILTAMSDFVGQKAQDETATEFDPNLLDQLNSDLDALASPELSDEELSRIEARWQSTLDYFLDSDMYKPKQEVETPEVSADEIVGDGTDSDMVTPPEPVEGAPATPEVPGAAPAAPQLPEQL